MFVDGLEGSLGQRRSQDGRLLSQPADAFCKRLPWAALSGQFQKCTWWPGTCAPAGRSVISKASAGSPPRGLGAQHSSHPGLWPCGQELEPPADAGQLPKIITRAAAGSAMWGWGLWPTCPHPPCSHSDPLQGTRASITKRRSLKHRDVGVTAGSHSVIGAEAGSELV